MPGRITPIVKKELRQIVRDERTLILLLIVPAFLLLMYGYALNFDVKHVGLAVLDLDKSPDSRDFIGAFLRTEYFDLKFDLRNESEVGPLLDDGKVSAAMVIPLNFSRSLKAGKTASLQFIVDGSNASSASTVVGYVNAITRSYSAKVQAAMRTRRGRESILLPVDFRPRIWYNPELQSAQFLIPGLIAFILMVILVVSTAFAVVREKERGTMEQIIVSPIRPIELIAGKTIPYIAISLISSHLVLLLGYLLFDVSIKGSYFWLLAVMFLFLVGGLGMGLLISTFARTQQVAFMLAILTTFLPTFLLSGFVFPIRNMPLPIQAFTYLLPARYFLSALRSIILKGAGWEAFWNQMLFLAGFAFLVISLATLRLKRSKEKGEG
ncbi:MAG: ABC transporter permease [Candidatus Aminicenantales bacterium]